MSHSIEALEVFRERFAEILDTDDALKPDAELPRDWQDDLSELADGLVPIYYRDTVDAWLEAGMPEVDDQGLIEDRADIMQQMQVALYETYSTELYQLANDAGFD